MLIKKLDWWRKIKYFYCRKYEKYPLLTCDCGDERTFNGYLITDENYLKNFSLTWIYPSLSSSYRWSYRKSFLLNLKIYFFQCSLWIKIMSLLSKLINAYRKNQSQYLLYRSITYNRLLELLFNNNHK